MAQETVRATQTSTDCTADGDYDLINGLEDILSEEDFYGDEWEDVYEEIFDELEEDDERDHLLEQFGQYSDVRVIKCAAHTVQLGVNDYIKKDQDVVEFIKIVTKSATKWRDYINKHRKSSCTPSLANDTR